jgi:predicted alpha/beta-fold hydrolase
MCTIALTDGDRLAVHDSVPASWQPGNGVAVLVHGLSGCHQSGYMRRLTRLLVLRNVRVLRLDLRGVGAGAALARRTYHGGCSDDVRAVLADVHRRWPDSPLALIGMSLGGNVALKLAGEAAQNPVSALQAVAAVGPPIDLVRCADLLARRTFYQGFFVRGLVNQVRRHQGHFPDLPRTRFPRRLTMRLFDDIYTAPAWGFADAQDYYQKASALPVLAAIRVPSLVITARDDPFIAVEPFEELRAHPCVRLVIADRGGHLGFLGPDGAGGMRWAEQRLADWTVDQLRAAERR